MMEKTVREILANINTNPRYYPPPLDPIAVEVVRKVRKRITKLAMRSANSDNLAIMLDDILSAEYGKGIISAYYYLTRELGLDIRQATELIIRAIEVLAGLEKPLKCHQHIEP